MTTTLCLHRGAKEVDFDRLLALPTPAGTDTHAPLPHGELVSMVRYALGYHQHEIVDEHHALSEDHARYFGLLSLKSPDGAYTDTLGLRNSHDKTFPIGLSFGSRVFVCDNLAFSGDYVIRRKHTSGARRDMPGLVSEIIAPLQRKREQQQSIFALYQGTPLTEQVVDHALLTLFRRDVLNSKRLIEALGQWETPSHDWGGRTAWRLFNAVTHALSGHVIDKPQLTTELHKTIDGICETVH